MNNWNSMNFNCRTRCINSTSNNKLSNNHLNSDGFLIIRLDNRSRFKVMKYPNTSPKYYPLTKCKKHRIIVRRIKHLLTNGILKMKLSSDVKKQQHALFHSSKWFLNNLHFFFCGGDFIWQFDFFFPLLISWKDSIALCGCELRKSKESADCRKRRWFSKSISWRVCKNTW